NTGTAGADLRGAIQTSVNGGNISDARLTGAGVTAGGYGPIAVATNSGNLAVGFTAASAGALSPLSGQAINFRSNFDNIADQKLNIALAGGAAAYNIAVGNTTTPLNLGNTRVGGALSGNLNVSNTAPNNTFSEKLDAAFGANGGGVSNNGGAISLLAAGSSNNSSMGVSLGTATSGAKTGTATVNYTSNGAGTSGLGTIGAGSQTVNVNGNVYAVAVGQLNSTPLNFGTVQVGQSVSKVLSITNAGTGAAGFVEDLNASFGATSGTGSSLISGTGSIAGLLAGATNTSAMTVSVNTSAAGSVAGNILVNYVSAGAVNGSSNGLGTLAVGNSLFGVNGNIQAVANVVNQASPIINNAPINLGNVRVGAASPTGLVSVTNQMTTAPQAALNASIAGNGSITASGSFNLLDPGSTNASSLAVGMNTATAGNKSGNATIGFVSDASNIGNCAPNCQLTLASQNVAVNGAVYRLANPTVSNAPINLVARVGDAAPVASIGITNVSPDIFTERLDASFSGAAPVGFTTSGSITGLAAQGSSTALKAALNTSTAGVFSGNANIGLTSSGVGTTGAADFALAPGSASLNGKVYAAAIGLVNTPSVDFGIVHVGDVVSAQNVSVSNSATPVALNDVLKGDITGGSAQFGVSGSLGGIAAGNTNNSSLNVGFNTGNAGVYTGSASVNLKSSNPDMADLSLGSTSVGLKGTVNNYASAAFAKSSGSGAFNFINGGWVLDFGSVAMNSSSLSASLGVKNTATGPADDLNGAFQFGAPSAFGFTGFSQFTGVGAGAIFGGLGVLFNTTSLGQFSQIVTLNSFGSNMSGYMGNLADLQLTVMGNVTGVVTPPVTTAPEPSTFVLMIAGLGFVGWARKRHSTRNAR
ncbi:MAG: choice-of-anchor D domain-containing protein, partial [Gemmatimonadaceae bacterium]